MIKNIKWPVIFRREYSVSVSYHFFEIDKIFIDLLSESCEEGGGGEFLYWVTKMSQYFLSDQPEFLVAFYKLFQ